ncbi:M14 family metallopeptidase [candidate division KSB1 bacterium]|nr:M14 family metallopeptidase [candidate division KSB1 bacterium]
MKLKLLLLLTLGLWGLSWMNMPAASSLPQSGALTPAQFFGFTPGSDRMLFDYENLIGYLKQLAANSPRLKLIEIGQSPQGKPLYLLLISAETNIKNLARLQEINRRLALEPDLAPAARAQLVAEGKVFVLATLSMHSTEVGPTQAAPQIAYELAFGTEPKLVQALDEVVYMQVPCHNPDGMDLVVQHYLKYKGTKYEGSSLPGLYHQYVGHDNNRDFVTLSQSDTRAVARIYNLDWFPQVMVEKHQMGSTSARYFVPPSHDPIAENIAAGVWNWIGIFGANLIQDMTAAGLAGVSQHYLFDDYWPGSTTTSIWKNVIGFLTECASVKLATPIFVEPNELGAYGKGLAEYAKSINMPLPWEGGWWRLQDIVKYEISSTYSILETAARQRAPILDFRNELCRQEYTRGKTQPPYAYVLPLQQADAGELIDLVNLMLEHGVQVSRLKSPVSVENNTFQPGDFIISMAQPFRPFIKEVLEKQIFPVRHYTPDGVMIEPYDITTWSLPLHRGVTVHAVNQLFNEITTTLENVNSPLQITSNPPAAYWGALYSINHNASYKAAFLAHKLGLKVRRLTQAANVAGKTYPAGSFVILSEPEFSRQFGQMQNALPVAPVFLPQPIQVTAQDFQPPRIALVETYFHDIDAGWTRFVFDSYAIPFQLIRPADFSKTDLVKNFDVLIFPDENKEVLMSGKYKSDDQYYVSNYPPEYTKGIGKEGFNRILRFLNQGGVIISWGGSTNLFLGTLEMELSKDEKEEFQLPIRNIAGAIKKKGLNCPGSLLKIRLLPEHPITQGMPPEIGIFFRGEPVFATSIPNFDMDRRVIGKFAATDILMSGYCDKVEELRERSILVWLKKGKGQLVLMGFNPQFRASTPVSYKLLFNSILLPPLN